MKKQLVLVVMMCFVFTFAVGGVLGYSQIPEVDVESTIDFTLDTLNLDYGSIQSGVNSAEKDTLITIGINNNVNLELSIELTDAGNSNIFENIYYDLNGDVDYTDKLLLSVPISTILVDPAGGVSRQDTLKSILKVPAGTGPLNSSGIIMFTVTENSP